MKKLMFVLGACVAMATCAWADAAAVAEIVEAEAAVENPDPEANQSETDRQAQEDRNALKNAGPADDGAGGASKADEDGPVVTAAVADIDARDRALIEGVMANNATNEIEDEGLRRLHADPPFIDLKDEYETVEDLIERERRAAEEARLRGEDFQSASMEFSDRFLAEQQRRADELRVDLESREAEKGKPDPAPHPYDGMFGDDDEVWFAEDATTVAAALTAEGVTADGVWSNLTDQVEIVGEKVVIDADDATPVAYRPNAALTANAASVTLTNLTFEAARTELPELAADVQAAVTITTNGAGACVFAIANNGEWELTATNANPEAVYTVKVGFNSVFGRNTVTYSVSNETGWVALESDAVNPQTARVSTLEPVEINVQPAKVSTVEFAGCGSFTAFDGFHAAVPPAEGSKDNPWVIGMSTNDDVRAYTNGTLLVIEGTGDMRNWELDSAPWSKLPGPIASVAIAEGVARVGDESFFDRPDLGEVAIPASVTNIGWSAFLSCASLSNVTFAAGSQLESIGDYAFADCPSMVRLEVPAGVVNCGSAAFVDTPNVTVNPDNRVFAIVNGLFCDIRSMRVISGLAAADVTIPESMGIGEFAFDGSKDLRFVEIPASVTNIGEGAFSDCSLLMDAVVLAIEPPALGEGAFDGCGQTSSGEVIGEGLKIHVPACRSDAYKAAEGWSAYADNIVELSFVPVTLRDAVFCDSAEVATNVAKAAVFVPSAEVVGKLGAGTTVVSNYCAKFGFAAFKVLDGKWAVVAALKPEARTEVFESARAATRQIPVGDIAALPLYTPTNVTAKGCGVPGFYYSFYSGSTVTNLGALAAEKGRNVLCGTDGDVEFSGVVKPSDAAGFFTIGVKETPGVQPSDTIYVPPAPRFR